MTQGEAKNERTGLPESLRTAVERTLTATAGTAAETAERAQELLDEVARRGQRTREGISRIRFASAEEVKELDARLAAIERRLGEIERGMKESAKNKAQPEG